MKNTAFILIGTVFAATLEIVWQPFLPSWLAIRPLLPFFILLLILQKRRALYPALFLGGLLLDAYAFESGGGTIVRLFVIFPLLAHLAAYWLTNRSLYTSVILVLVGRVLFMALGWLIAILLFIFGRARGWPVVDVSMVWTCLWDVIFVAVGFVVLARWTRLLSGPVRSRLTDWRLETYGK